MLFIAECKYTFGFKPRLVCNNINDTFGLQHQQQQEQQFSLIKYNNDKIGKIIELHIYIFWSVEELCLYNYTRIKAWLSTLT